MDRDSPIRRVQRLDSFTAAAIPQRHEAAWLAAHITSPAERAASMNSVAIQHQNAAEANTVLIGSGNRNLCDIATDAGLLFRMKLDPSRQLVGT